MKMAKCPKCKGELSSLFMYEKRIVSFDFWLRPKDGSCVYDEMNYSDDGEDQEYVCPECGGIITTTEEEAIKVLKGTE